jgi:[ribosomal protein S18]-alanine N-acetyltransferase
MPIKMSFKITRFRLEDIDKIYEIEKMAFPKTAYSKETLIRYALGLPETFIIIGDDKETAGYLIFDKTGYIYSAAIKPEYRKMGLGTRLFMYAKKSSRQRLWLEVRSKNTAAIRFYKKMGMKVIKEIPNYYENDNAFVMILHKKPKS